MTKTWIVHMSSLKAALATLSKRRDLEMHTFVQGGRDNNKTTVLVFYMCSCLFDYHNLGYAPSSVQPKNTILSYFTQCGIFLIDWCALSVNHTQNSCLLLQFLLEAKFVDEFSSTLPGWSSDMCIISFEVKTSTYTRECVILGANTSHPPALYFYNNCGTLTVVLLRQEVLIWLTKLVENLGQDPTTEEVKDYCIESLKTSVSNAASVTLYVHLSW